MCDTKPFFQALGPTHGELQAAHHAYSWACPLTLSMTDRRSSQSSTHQTPSAKLPVLALACVLATIPGLWSSCDLPPKFLCQKDL